MEYRKLGHSNIKVSVISLGTMTWGEQNTESQAHEQLDYAIDHGINFIDVAEMYPVPPRQETQGLTESFLGTWLEKQTKRDQLFIATKVSGPGMQDYLRKGPRLSREHIRTAIDDSLKRLKTDYIDLYQVHWPERSTNFFGELGYTHTESPDAVTVEETLSSLAELVDEGKIRYLGISNETPWGVMEYLRLAERHHWPHITSIQNPYNLLNRTFEIGLAEMAHREKVDLLAYSPLGFGVLSGKYLDHPNLPNARLTLFPRFSRYTNDLGVRATREYVQIAKDAGLNPAAMALAYVNSRGFLATNIIGATTMEQLKTNVGSIGLILPEDVLNAIEQVHIKFPNPCP